MFPDKHGVVRTCEVGFRKKSPGEKPLSYQPKPLQKLRIAVQRVCVLLPLEEQDGYKEDNQDPLEQELDTCRREQEPVDVVEEPAHDAGPSVPHIPPLGFNLEPECDGLDDRSQFGDLEIPGKKKLSRREKKDKAQKCREPRRFSRRLAGFSAALRVAVDLGFYLSSDEDD